MKWRSANVLSKDVIRLACSIFLSVELFGDKNVRKVNQDAKMEL